MAGQNSVVRQCAVVGTGGLAVDEGEGGTDTSGIAVVGPGAQLLDNDVSDTRGNGSGRGRALFVRQGQGTVVHRNRLVGDSGATGLLVVESNDVLAIRNRFAGFAAGIVFDGVSSGAYRGNLTSGVAAPYSGGTDAGGNE